jgi:hypothetical protein
LTTASEEKVLDLKEDSRRSDGDGRGELSSFISGEEAK